MIESITNAHSLICTSEPIKIPGGEYSQNYWWRCAARFPKPLPSVFMTKIGDFPVPYSRPDQKLDTLFMTVAADTVAMNIMHLLLFMVLSITMEDWLLLKNIPNSRLEYKHNSPDPIYDLNSLRIRLRGRG